ncbi:biopolymer transporter ExbD [Massilia sp. PAMC28688]|uniref:ExbD/TolR family protein n=1 Tax=Massilia sp. PAMC28688 TaxID=2861283 RepID=UPI001C62975D|nr:biopolymer transporter ExbD [Massilia sp. PAMC28688]QYF93438.1 biopolymer transporter ExbD [Massilia sp. PAMC28688]
MHKKTASPASANAVPEPMMDMNMTPLIDVMLVLIIMLIITIPRQHHATSLPLQGAASNAVKPVTVTLEIDFDGTISVDGTVMTTRAELAARLGQMARSATPSELHLRANKLASYKYVAGAMALAQRAGVKHIGLVGNEQLM